MRCRRGRAAACVTVRVVAVGYLAGCTVCGQLVHMKLVWEDRDKADEVRCPTCGGPCEAYLDETLAAELDVQGAPEITT